MKKVSQKTKWLSLLALMVAIELVLFMTGIGLIPLPIIKATTMHIPVILGAILLGPVGGGILGGVFGLCSIWANTTTPNLVSFAFSPFLSTTGLKGALSAIWIALGCRILIGVVAGLFWKLLKKVDMDDYPALPITAMVGSLTNTVCVMGSIYFLLGEQYAQAKNVAMDTLFNVIMGVVATAGVPEAAAAVVLVTAIGRIMLQWKRSQGISD